MICPECLLIGTLSLL
jgi:hypothetical protein